MKNKPLKIAVAVLVVVFGMTLGYGLKDRIFKKHLPPTYANMVHGSLFRQADDFWNSELAVLPFRPQEINNQEYGSSTAFRAEWTAPEQDYNHFVLTITEPRTGWTRSESREHDGFALDLTQLKPDTKYTLVLQACKDPRCLSWFTGEDEHHVRTEKMIFQVDETMFAISEGLLEDQEIEKQRSTFIYQDTQLINSDVAVENIYGLEGDLWVQFKNESNTFFARLMNP